MTSPDQDFERKLKATFASHAGDAPRVDLTDGALREAGRIRTRRRIAAGLVAAGLVAVAIPVGVQLSDTSSHRRPVASDPTGDLVPAPTEAVDVRLAGLQLGDAPDVPYLHGNTFTKDGVSTPVGAADGELVSDVVAVDDGVLIWSHKQGDNNAASYSPAGPGAALPVGKWASNPAYDSVAKEAAWAVRGVDGDGQPVEGDTILVANSVQSVAGWASTGKLKVDHVMGLRANTVVFNAHNGGGDAVVARVNVSSSAPTIDQPWTDATSITAIDPAFTRVAAVINGDKTCSTMLAYDDASEQWSSCTWRPVEFSADGTRVLGIPTNTDGIGPNRFAVLDAESGALIQKFSTLGFFGRMTFEDDDTVVGVLAIDGEAAVVRCTIGADCELATETAKVDTSQSEAVHMPYELTAN
jgi:hypothetical protein